jgi:hypothetical protein
VSAHSVSGHRYREVMDDRSPMVPVATASSGFEARLLAARLGSEGILWELRGNVDGPYPVGPVQVLVPQDRVAEVRELLIADDVEAAFEARARDGAGERTSARELWLVALIVAGLVAFALARIAGAAA